MANSDFPLPFPEWGEAAEPPPKTTKLHKNLLVFPGPSGASARHPAHRRQASAALSQCWGQIAKNNTAPSVVKAGNTLRVQA